METVSLAKNVHWVGAKDPGLTVFDIVIPTEFGTTYNAYLVRGTEKTALIDCVKREFTEDLFRNISRVLPVEKLDYVVINHSEPDHAGGIVELLKRNPKVTVYLSRSAKSFVDHLVNAEYPHRIVKDNEELPLGGKTLRFLNTPFLHWPDTILTYLVEDKILFPCDFLGGSCTGRTPSSRISSRTRFSSRAIFSGRTTAAPSSSTTKSASRRRCARRSSSTTA
jgi:flavorubredoxin